MPSNDRVVLQELLRQSKSDVAPSLDDDQYFELFTAEQVLKNRDLSYEELENGLVGNPQDGGVDSVYSFVDGTLLSEDTDLTVYKRGVSIELVVLQAKTSPSFAEAPLTKFRHFAEDLLDLSQNVAAHRASYTEKLLHTIAIFREAVIALTKKFPHLVFRFVYASQGDTRTINVSLRKRVQALEKVIRDLYGNSEVNVEFLGARESYKLAAAAPSTTLTLDFQEIVSTGDKAYICLVNLKDYYRFMTNSDHSLRTGIFESNVRDYQGLVEVNSAILATLEKNEGQDFWWLNNGITIVANRGQISGKTITVEDAQVVNGLQSSRIIHEFFVSHPRTKEKRNLLVRIVVTEDPVTRDKIIKATNSQTSIPSASLHATDEFQRMLETYFKAQDIYYERRKNFYKNQAFPKDKIISIPFLAQAVVAILLRQPNNSRARPSSLLKKASDYIKVFNPSYPMGTYLASARIMKQVDTHLRTDRANYPAEERSNLRFHVALCAVAGVLQTVDYRPADVAKLVEANLSSEYLLLCLTAAVGVFRDYCERTGDSADKAAKSKAFDAELIEYLGKDGVAMLAVKAPPL